MNIALITPAVISSRSGNWTTAARWARLLRRLGHRVRVATDYDGRPADLMIAVHAWRSAASIRRFRELNKEQPLIVALSGTDVNEYIARDPAPTLHSLAVADRLVGLQPLVRRRVPARFRAKLSIIHQSAAPLRRRRTAAQTFEVAVIGHLREVKDPLRTAAAARRLPRESRLTVIHLGAAGSTEWAEKAKAEMAANPRYRWRGDVPGAEVRRLLGRVRAMVLSSLSEGGANVISEAVAAGVPILASRIDGTMGLLGSAYPGYFPAGDAGALARLLHRIEAEPGFLARLRRAVMRRRHLFHPARELAAWKKLLDEITHRGGRAKRLPLPREGERVG